MHYTNSSNHITCQTRWPTIGWMVHSRGRKSITFCWVVAVRGCSCLWYMLSPYSFRMHFCRRKGWALVIYLCKLSLITVKTLLALTTNTYNKHTNKILHLIRGLPTELQYWRMEPIRRQAKVFCHEVSTCPSWPCLYVQQALSPVFMIRPLCTCR